MTLLKRRLNDRSSRRIDEEIQKNKVINLGIPVMSTHNLKDYQRNKVLHILNEPDKRPPERQWQQMKVMLPILRTSGAVNMTRNEMLAKKLTEHQKTRLNEHTIHSPAELTDFNIQKQFGMERKRYSPKQSPAAVHQFDNWEKRVTFTDLRRKARGPRGLGAADVAQSARREEREALLRAQKADDRLQREIDYVAEALANEAEREEDGTGQADQS